MRQQQREFATLAENMSEGVVLLNTKGRILSYNSGALRLLGAVSPAEQASVLTLDRSDAFRTVVERALAGQRAQGRLERGEEGKLVFSYRPWLVLGRKRQVVGNAGEFAAGRGLVNIFLVADSRTDTPCLRLPPRYRSGAEELAHVFGLRRVTDCGVAGSLRSWLAAQFSGKPTGECA